MVSHRFNPFMFSKKESKISTLPTTEQTSLNDLWLREDNSVSGSCSYLASSLHNRAITCICRWGGELGSQTCLLFNTIPPDGLNIMDILSWFSALCTQRLFVLLCLYSFTLGDIILTCRCSLVQTGEPLPIYTSEKLPLSDALRIPGVMLVLLFLAFRCPVQTFLRCAAGINSKY